MSAEPSPQLPPTRWGVTRPLHPRQRRILDSLRTLWSQSPRYRPQIQRAVSVAVLDAQVPLQVIADVLELPYFRAVRLVKRATGLVPTALATTVARAENRLTQAEMIALLSNREYDPPLGTNTGIVDVEAHPNSVSVLQQAYLRGLVTQGELWEIADTITVRAASEDSGK
ncbi:MAG: hypothetical protein ACTHXA_09335 [Gulosibacter sp.]|uniref:hypothetical protein n=1 Tax=Gulosibacter sp. TaxID=2817531 RepID=UPI003F8E9276